MGGFYIVLGIVVWVVVAFWPATIAHRKGHSFFGFFIFSIIFFPAALITALLISDRNAPKHPEKAPDDLDLNGSKHVE